MSALGYGYCRDRWNWGCAIQFDGDDGSLAYATGAGIYLRGVEAPRFPERAVVRPAIARDTAVIVAFGQSNAANCGEGRYRAGSAVCVFNVHDSTFYRAECPLPGASNDGAAVWGRLADKLIDRGIYRSVILVPIAMGGSFLREWAPGGQYHRRLMFALHRMKMAHLVPTVMCWHQGEAEANLTDMSAVQYRQLFHAMVADVRGAGISAPIYAAVATLCANEIHPFHNYRQIRLGQQQLVSSKYGIYPGPDTDIIGVEHRFDRCHFSASGLDLHAEGWFRALTTVTPGRRRNGLFCRPGIRRMWAGKKVDAMKRLSRSRIMVPVKNAVLKLLDGQGYILLRKADYYAKIWAVTDRTSDIAPSPVPPLPPLPSTDNRPDDTPLAGPWAGDSDFARFCEKSRKLSNLPVEDLHATYLAVRHVTDAGIPGAIVDSGNGASDILAVIALALVEFGDTNRKLLLLDVSGDPSHRAEIHFRLWGAEPDWLGTRRPAARKATVAIPPEIIATNYPVEKVTVVRTPAAPIESPDAIALLVTTPESYQANIMWIDRLIPKVSDGGVIAIRSDRAVRASDDAVLRFLADNGPKITFRASTDRYRIGIKPKHRGKKA